MGLGFSTQESQEKIDKIKVPYQCIIDTLNDNKLHPAVKKHLISEQLAKIKPCAITDTLIEEIFPNENQNIVIIVGVFGPLYLPDHELLPGDAKDNYVYIKIKKIADTIEYCFKTIKITNVEKTEEPQKPEIKSIEPIIIEQNYKTNNKKKTRK